MVLGSGPFLMRKYVCQLSLCPSTPLLSCSGICWVTSLQAGLVGGLWDSFIDFVSCGKTRTVFSGKYLLSSWHAQFCFCARAVEVHCSFCFFQLLSTTVFSDSALILGNFLQPGNFIGPVWGTKTMGAGYWGNNRAICFGRICGTWKMELN